MPRSEDSRVICSYLSSEDLASHHKQSRQVLHTLLAVSPFLAILSAPTTGLKKVSGDINLNTRSHTNGVDLMMLE